MPSFVSKAAAAQALRQDLDDAQWQQLDALLRRAERELRLLIGPLEPHDQQLVADTLIDAVREEWHNPDRYRSETDNTYSYTRYALPSGEQGRFWWPTNLYGLFGLQRPGKALRVIPVGLSPAGRGWLPW